MPQKSGEIGTPESCSAGAPNPRMKITRIVGTPRNRSVYAIASARKGKKTGPGRLRKIATKSANTSTTASAIKKIRTFSANASAMSGNASLKIDPSKNARWTSGQPGEVTTATEI